MPYQSGKCSVPVLAIRFETLSTDLLLVGTQRWEATSLDAHASYMQHLQGLDLRPVCMGMPSNRQNPDGTSTGASRQNSFRSISARCILGMA